MAELTFQVAILTPARLPARRLRRGREGLAQPGGVGRLLAFGVSGPGPEEPAQAVTPRPRHHVHMQVGDGLADDRVVAVKDPWAPYAVVTAAATRWTTANRGASGVSVMSLYGCVGQSGHGE